MRGGRKLIFAIFLVAAVFHASECTTEVFKSVQEHFQEKLQLNAMAAFKTEVLNYLKEIKYQLESGGKLCNGPDVTPKMPSIPNFPVPGFNGNPSSGGSSGGGGDVIDKIIHPCGKNDSSE